jgi:hypothetical protein
MSREEIVRKPLSASHRASRTLDERLIVRFPGLLRAVGRLVFRLSPKSRLRQAVIWRSISQGFGAVNRRDFAAVLPRYHPYVEIRLAPQFRALDQEAVYRGREGYLRIYRELLPAFGGGLRLEPRELIDWATVGSWDWRRSIFAVNGAGPRSGNASATFGRSTATGRL